MITNEILEEKRKVQQRLSQQARSIHDYLAKAHQAAKNLLQEKGISKYPDFSTPQSTILSDKSAEYAAEAGEQDPS